MLAGYPQPDASLFDETAERSLHLVRDIIVGIRNIRAEYKVEPAKFVAATIVSPHAELLNDQRPLLCRLARLNNDELQLVTSLAIRSKAAATVVIGDIEIFVPLAGLIDLAAERQRLSKELASAETDAERRRTRLADDTFTSKAPTAIVQRERDSLSAVEAQITRLRQRLDDYSD
jgi:valyl-tRNA synthetase